MAKKIMKTIILDTNFLVSVVKYKIDFIEELQRICNFSYKISIIDRSIDELESIKVDKTYKKMIIECLAKYDIQKIKTNKADYVDDLILDIIKPDIHFVATQDKELKRRIKDKGVQVITIRQKNHLQIER